MKKQQWTFIVFSFFILFALSGCKAKYGCPINENKQKVDRKGNIKTGKSRSNLFPKRMRKN